MVKLLHVPVQVLHEVRDSDILQLPKGLELIHIFIGDLRRKRTPENPLTVPAASFTLHRDFELSIAKDGGRHGGNNMGLHAVHSIGLQHWGEVHPETLKLSFQYSLEP